MVVGAGVPRSLDPYRVLDLTEGGYNWGGRILADLGADVIKVEPPEGSATRRFAPFYKGVEDPERSLYWWAYCLNKRSVALDLESKDGRSTFLQLAATTDVILESFPPGYLDGLGLGYEDLMRANRGLIMTSITPFGQTGPYAHFKSTDMVSWSMGGMQYLSGDDDRPPVRVGFPQAQVHAGAQGAAGTMIALWHRVLTGEGQRIDVSTQEAVVWTLMNAAPFPKLAGVNLERAGGSRKHGDVVARDVFRAKDGYLSSVIGGGLAGGQSMNALVKWMDTEGRATDAMKIRDWPKWDFYAAMASGSDEVQELLDAQSRVAEFFLTKTKADIYERAIADKIIVAPCNTAQDIWESPQLSARDYWADVDIPGVGVVRYPGAYVKLSETPVQIKRAPPTVGQHDREILSELKTSPRVPVGGGVEHRALPFEGLRVLDMSWVGVGPLTMDYLADHGATVVRVESVIRPDPARSVPPFGGNVQGFNRSQFPANFNTSKYGLGLNLTKPESIQLIRKILIDWKPDIIAQSFTPRAMKKWALDYDSVREFRPDIVYYSTCQQGQTGPHALFAGYGGQAAALAGFYHITGWPDRDPAGPYGAYTDFVNPPNGLAAVVAALDHRRRTGQGQHIDLSQFECAVQYIAPAILDYGVTGSIFNRRGNLDDRYVPHNVYPCEQVDDPLPGGAWCAIVVTSDEEWHALIQVMDSPSLASDPRFASFEDRKRHEEELDQLIAAWTCRKKAHEVMVLLQDAGVPAGVVQAASDLWKDPQLEHRGFFRWLEHTECGPMPYNGPQFQLSVTPADIRWAAPLVGEHNELVLKEFLGLGDDEIGDLIVAEALETSF